MTPPTEDATSELLAGRYARKELLGRGAMADVYRAEDVLLGRDVALKILRVSADGSHPAPRARVEMALLASLNHPALVTLYDGSVESERTSFLVMELVDGPTLAEELHRGPLPPDEVAKIAAELADGLDAVHAAGVVHRDIKPSNILLAGAPGRRRAKLADFGIAHMTESERLTSPGLVVGTAAYLAPEQLRGAPPAPPADIYALGLVLREALVGERAFPGAAGIGAATARLLAAPDVPEWVGPGWHALLTQMTSTDAALRPTAREVSDAVATLPTPHPRPTTGATEATARTTSAPGTGTTAVWAADPGPPPPVPTTPAPAAPGAHRRRRAAILAVAAVGLVASIGVGAAWWPDSGSASIPRASTPVLRATPEATPATAVDEADPASTTDGAADGAGDTRAARKAAAAAEREAQKAADRAEREADKKSGEKGKPGKD